MRSPTRRPTPSTAVSTALGYDALVGYCDAGGHLLTVPPAIVDKAVEYILGQPDGKCNTLACAIEFILRGFSTDYSASSLNMNVMRGLGVDWGT